MSDGPRTVPAIGDLVAERYEVLEQIGEGGMGVVYRVRHVEMDLELALKVLHPALADVATLPERFNREARAIAALNDPRIVRVTDFGRTEAGLPFMTMELLDGGSLLELMERGRLPVERALFIVDQVLAGLDHAHQRGVVHRDLKPENVIVADQVKLLDFGIAQLESADQKLTQPNVIFGSPRYMSPEQATGDAVDHRSDLYAVGVMLFELLTGRPPFVADTPSDVLKKHVVVPPPPLELDHPQRLALQAVVHRAMAKRAEDRPASAAELRTDLQSALQGRPPTNLGAEPRGVTSSLQAAARALTRRFRALPRPAQAALVACGVAVMVAAVSAPLFEASPHDEATQALARGDPRGALRVARAGLVEAPDDARLHLITGHALLATEQDEDARAAYGRALTLDSTSVSDARLQATVRRLIESRGRLAQSMILLVLEHASSADGSFIAELTSAAPHPRLRRAAYERLEAVGRASDIDRFAFLSGELKDNRTDVCSIRRWYVERLIGLHDPRSLPILRREQKRTHGPLGLPIHRTSTCMQSELQEGIQALTK